MWPNIATVSFLTLPPDGDKSGIFKSQSLRFFFLSCTDKIICCASKIVNCANKMDRGYQYIFVQSNTLNYNEQCTLLRVANWALDVSICSLKAAKALGVLSALYYSNWNWLFLFFPFGWSGNLCVIPIISKNEVIIFEFEHISHHQKLEKPLMQVVISSRNT